MANGTVEMDRAPCLPDNGWPWIRPSDGRMKCSRVSVPLPGERADARRSVRQPGGRHD